MRQRLAAGADLRALADTVGLMDFRRFTRYHTSTVSARLPPPLLVARTMASEGPAEALLSFADDLAQDRAAAIILAGAALELRLKELLPPDVGVQRGSIANYGVALRKAKLIDLAEQQELQSWAALRNDAVHGELAASVTMDRARSMISNVSDFLRRHQ